MTPTVALALLAVVAGVLVLAALAVLVSTHRPPAPDRREPRQPGAQAPPPFPEKVTARRSMTRESFDPSGRPMKETDEREIAYQGPAAAQVAGRALALPGPPS
jgi:cell division protein FtsN